MGAPPNEIANAGRMNPAGISYLYMSFESGTAYAEVLGRPPCGAVVARFVSKKDLKVLDLSALPGIPSMFDDKNRREYEVLTFLYKFVNEITRPLQKDGREHIEYVPSQVVSEYFCRMFKLNRKTKLDGIVYPSAVRRSGKNIVLFPVENSLAGFPQIVDFTEGQKKHFPTWGELSKELK